MSEKGDSRFELESLTEGIRQGDTRTFDRFLKLQWGPLVAYANVFVRNPDDAMDIVQEALVRLWEQRTDLRPSGSVRQYVYQIVRNLAINECRRVERHDRLNAREAERLRPRLPTPSRVLDQAELDRVVRAAVEALPARRREAFTLAHFQDLPHREISEIMGIAPQTVANQISAALGDLREALQPYLDRGSAPELRQSG